MTALPQIAFDSIAPGYDDLFTESAIGRAQRTVIWREMDRVFHRGHRILEINCGTGVDAVHLASRGVRVEACDSSSAMIMRARDRAGAAHMEAPVAFQCLSIEEIHRLSSGGPYDGLLSNFAGLNCVPDLRPVARSLAQLVRPGGSVVLCLFGRFCLWEVAWYLFAGSSTKAFRRFAGHSVQGTLSSSVTVAVYYPSIRTLKEIFAPDFRLIRWRGVGVAVPPSYAASFASRFPRLFRVAAGIDPALGRYPVFRSLADHMVLTFQRVEASRS